VAGNVLKRKPDIVGVHEEETPHIRNVGNGVADVVVCLRIRSESLSRAKPGYSIYYVSQLRIDPDNDRRLWGHLPWA
jgi:hypothetical protein